MRTHSFNRQREASDKRHDLFLDDEYTFGAQADAAETEREAGMLQLAQEQMLVNQALVEKILACERREEALRASEQVLHDLLAHQTTHREEERKRISHRLHDSLAQNLLALRIDIVLLYQHTTNRHYRLRDRIGAALDNVDITLRTVKDLLGELRPPCIELGLLASVEAEVRKFTRTSGIACKLTAGPALAELVLDEESLLTAHRALQECLNNIARHSLASRVKVRLDAGKDRLDMRIQDNGIGFDPAAPCPCGYGLLDLQERVSSCGGTLRISASRGQGTEVCLSIPIRAEPASSRAEAVIG